MSLTAHQARALNYLNARRGWSNVINRSVGLSTARILDAKGLIKLRTSHSAGEVWTDTGVEYRGQLDALAVLTDAGRALADAPTGPAWAANCDLSALQVS